MPKSNYERLTSLPPELFDTVLSHLAIEDISRLSRTSKAVRFATIHLVFNDVTIVWTRDDKFWTRRRLFRDECAMNLPLLLRSIMEKPIYGGCVRKINLECSFPRPHIVSETVPFPSRSEFELYPSPTSDEYHGLVKETLQRTGLYKLDIGVEMEIGLKNNDLDATIALLIYLCPEITNLALGANIIRYCRNCLPTILREYALPSELSGSVSRLQNLEDLVLGTTAEAESTPYPKYLPVDFNVTEPSTLYARVLIWLDWEEEWRPSSNYLPWKFMFNTPSYFFYMYLPKLKRARLHIHYGYREGLARGFKHTRIERPVMPSWDSPLQTLMLPNSYICPRVLGDILEHTRCLTRLHYDHWIDIGSAFMAGDLANALKCISGTLLHLEIGIRAWDFESGTVEMEENTYDSKVEGYCPLKHLTALQTVTIPFCVLFGWWNIEDVCPGLADVLPVQVRTVCFNDDLAWFEEYEMQDENIFPAIQEFVGSEAWRVATPQLREINLAICHKWEREGELSELCRQNGLSSKAVSGRMLSAWT